MYHSYPRKRRHWKAKVFFLLLVFACIGFSFAVILTLRGAGSAAITRPQKSNYSPDLPILRRQGLYLLEINIPDAGISWRVRDDQLEITIISSAAMAVFPEEDCYLDQDIALYRKTGSIVLAIGLGQLPPIISVRTTANGYAVQWLEAGLAGKRIALDPGHGGHDPGSLGKHLGLKEKDVTLAIALQLQQLLKQAGAEVFMTRDTDSLVDTNVLPNSYIGPDLRKRYALVQGYAPDLFVSIHNNSWKQGDAYGIETYYNPDSLNGYTSREAAIQIQRALVDALKRYDRGIRYKERPDAVLQVDAPAVLAEILFISNKEEEKILSQDGFPSKAAQALFNGIISYFNPPGVNDE